MFTEPETKLQLPVPTPGTFPARFVEPAEMQRFWSLPALEAVGTSAITIFTWSLDTGQGPLDTSQERVWVPAVREFTTELFCGGF